MPPFDTQVRDVLAQLESMGVSMENVRGSALLNESIVEHGFGEFDIMSQADHPTMVQYANRSVSPKSARNAFSGVDTKSRGGPLQRVEYA